MSSEGDNKPKKRGAPKGSKNAAGVSKRGRAKSYEQRILVGKMHDLIGMPKAVQRLAQIIDEGADRDALKAIEIFFNYTAGKPQENIDITSDGKINMPIVNFIKSVNVNELEE